MSDSADRVPARLRRLARIAVGRPTRSGSSPRRAAPEQVYRELELHRTELAQQNEELRTARAELERAVRRYRELFEQAPLGYVTLDATGRITEANARAAVLLGAAEGAEPLGRTLASFLSEPDADRLHLHLKDVVSRGERRHLELTLPGEPERRLRIESVASAGAAASSCCRVMLIDLTELEATRSRLADLAARKELLLLTMTDAVVSCCDDGRVERLNRAAEGAFGYRTREVAGWNVSELVVDWRGRWHSGPRQVLARRKDGRRFPVQAHVGDAGVESGGGFLLILEDLTDRQRAERVLRETQLRFHRFAEHVEEVLYETAVDGRLSYVSPAYEQVWGRPLASALDCPSAWLDAVHPEDLAAVEDARKRLFKGDPFDEEYRIVRPDRSVRWVRDRAYRVGTDSNRVVGVARDVTDERQLEAELLQAQKLEAVGALAAGVAHDFGNLLQGVMGCLRVALDAEPSAPVESRLKEALQAMRRGATLVSQLTAFVRRPREGRERVDVVALVESLRGLIEQLLGRSIALELDLRAPEACVTGDPAAIQQLLMNLATNARDAMREGGAFRVTVDVRGEASGSRTVNLRVSDSGSGMDQTTRERAFEPFFTTKPFGHSTGLGLSTVLSIVRSMGGSIRVESPVGEGTTFVIELPARDRSIPTCRPTPVALYQDPRPGLRVLLVEDDDLTLRSLCASLEARNHRVTAVADARAALSVDVGAIDVVVTDLALPRAMNGLRLLERLRERRPALPIVLITANQATIPVPDDVSVLFKPVDVDVLIEHFPRVAGARAPRVLVMTAAEPSLAGLAAALKARGHRVVSARSQAELLGLVPAALQSFDALVVAASEAEWRSTLALLNSLRQRHPAFRAVIATALADVDGEPAPNVRAVSVGGAESVTRVVEAVESLTLGA